MSDSTRLTLILAVLTLVATPASHADAAPSDRVYVGTYLHDVTNFDQRNGTFEVDLGVWAKWRGSFDPSEIQLQNGTSDIEREDLGENSDGDWHVHRWRVRGTLRGEFPLHRFPFDAQTISVVFELPKLRRDLAPDLAGSGMAERFSITGWDYDADFSPRISQIRYASDLGTLENEGSSTAATRVQFDVMLHRPTVTVAVKLFMPLLLLLLIAVMALFLGPELVDPRAGIGVTVLLACFAFQFTVAGTIPDVAYLTVVDSLFIVAYGLSTLALVVTIAVYWLHRDGKQARALQVDRVFRVAIPLVTIAVTGYLLREPPPLPERGPRGYPHVDRHASARDVVRIGTLRVATPLANPMRLAVRAGLVRIDEHGARHGELAEQAPAVTNDMLGFLANGHVRVRWHLREGLKWSDGEPLTSEDFRFALGVSPDEHVVEIDTPDTRTLVLTYDSSIASALDGFSPLPAHQLRREARLDAGYEAVRVAQRTRTLATAGAYRITDFRVDDHVFAEANPHFIGSPPAIRRIELRHFNNADALAAAFQAGTIDIVVPNDLPLELVRTIEGVNPGSTASTTSENMLALSPDFDVPWLAALDVRRAIAMAIDRDALLRGPLEGLGQVAFTALVGVRPHDLSASAYDPARARSLLEAAGVIGNTLTITYGRRKFEHDVAAAIAGYLGAVGLAPTLVEEQPPANGGVRSRNHGGLLLSTIRADDEGDPRRFWNVARTSGRFSDASRNAAYDDATANLVMRWSHALYVERREQLRERIALALPERYPVIPLAFAPDHIVVAPSLDGWDEGGRFGQSAASWHFTP